MRFLGRIGVRFARRSRWLAQRLWLVAAAEIALISRSHWRRLEPEERAVIVLHHYLDLPLPEVAATLGIPLGTTKSRLYRGLREMRAALDADARPGSDIPEGRPA